MQISLRQLSIALSLAASLGAASACGSSDKPSSPDVWAVVDKTEIRRDEVEKAYRRVAPLPPAVPSEDEALATKLSIVDELITQEALVNRAAALKIDVPAADVDKAYEDRRQNMSEDAFAQELKSRSLTPEDMKASVRRELLADKVLEQEVASKVAVSDAEISDLFNLNRSQFNVAETQYRIAQIVVTPTRDPQLRNRKNDDAVTAEDAQRKIEMLMAKLKEGQRFSDLAMDYSEDPQSLPQGGDLGFISESDLKKVPQQLRDTVLKTNPGSVSVVSAGGAHTIVLVIQKETAGQRDLNTPGVRDQISNGLRDRKIQLLRAAYITKLRNDAKIVNYLARQIVESRSKPPAIAPSAPGK